MKLTTKTRKAMPQKDFAGPGKSFPIEDKTHARMAISGATRAKNAGNISASEADQIKTKARSKLGDTEHPQSHDAFVKLGTQ